MLFIFFFLLNPYCHLFRHLNYEPSYHYITEINKTGATTQDTKLLHVFQSSKALFCLKSIRQKAGKYVDAKTKYMYIFFLYLLM